MTNAEEWTFTLPLAVPYKTIKASFNYTKDSEFSALTESALGIIKVLGAVSAPALGAFYGFNKVEQQSLISELLEQRYVEYKGEELVLTPAGYSLFKNSDHPRITIILDAKPVNTSFLYVSGTLIPVEDFEGRKKLHYVHKHLAPKGWDTKENLRDAFLNNLDFLRNSILENNENFQNFHTLKDIVVKSGGDFPVLINFTINSMGEVSKSFPSEMDSWQWLGKSYRESLIEDLTNNSRWISGVDQHYSNMNMGFNDFMSLETNFWDNLKDDDLSFELIQLAVSDDDCCSKLKEKTFISIGDDALDFSTEESFQGSDAGKFLRDSVVTKSVDLYWKPAAFLSPVLSLAEDNRKHVLSNVLAEPQFLSEDDKNLSNEFIQKLLTNPQVEVLYIKNRAIAFVYHYCIGKLDSRDGEIESRLTIPIYILSSNEEHLSIGNSMFGIMTLQKTNLKKERGKASEKSLSLKDQLRLVRV